MSPVLSRVEQPLTIPQRTAQPPLRHFSAKKLPAASLACKKYIFYKKTSLIRNKMYFFSKKRCLRPAHLERSAAAGSQNAQRESSSPRLDCRSRRAFWMGSSQRSARASRRAERRRRRRCSGSCWMGSRSSRRGSSESRRASPRCRASSPWRRARPRTRRLRPGPSVSAAARTDERRRHSRRRSSQSLLVHLAPPSSSGCYAFTN